LQQIDSRGGNSGDNTCYASTEFFLFRVTVRDGT